ncbi:hypothetical protein B566_EDAN009944 [Ephemera danica]|nr:hypothetical protein B566_EDAN009944 [Ephemera danica]
MVPPHSLMLIKAPVEYLGVCTPANPPSVSVIMAFLGVKYTLSSRNAATGGICLTETGGVYSLSITSSIKPEKVVTFKLGEEVDHETLDGRHVKSVFTLEGNVLNEQQTGQDISGTNKREFTESQMIQTITLGDKVCTRVFKA